MALLQKRPKFWGSLTIVATPCLLNLMFVTDVLCHLWEFNLLSVHYFQEWHCACACPHSLCAFFPRNVCRHSVQDTCKEGSNKQAHLFLCVCVSSFSVHILWKKCLYTYRHVVVVVYICIYIYTKKKKMSVPKKKNVCTYTDMSL